MSGLAKVIGSFIFTGPIFSALIASDKFLSYLVNIQALTGGVITSTVVGPNFLMFLSTFDPKWLSVSPNQSWLVLFAIAYAVVFVFLSIVFHGGRKDK